MSTPEPMPSSPLPRRRFYRRRGFWLGSAVSVAGLVLLLLFALYWLLQTIAGRDLLLAQVVARLPVGASFTWGSIEGPLAGPLTLNDVDFRYQDLHFTAKRVHMEPELGRLLGRKLQLNRLELSDATLNLGKSDEPFEMPSWPGSLPQIEVPLSIEADAIVVDNLRITQLQQPMIDIHSVRGGITAADGEFRALQIQASTDRGDFTVDGRYLPRDNYQADLTVSARLPAARGRTPASFGMVARGDLSKMELAIAGRAPAPLHASLMLSGGDDPTWELKADSDALDPSLLVPPGDDQAGESLPIAFDLKAQGKGGDARLLGTVSRDGNKIVLQPSHVSLVKQVLKIDPLVIDAFDGRLRVAGQADFSDLDNTTFQLAVNAHDMRFIPAPDPATPGAPQVPVELKQAGLGVAGNIKAWAAVGRAQLARDGEQAKLHFDVRGDDRHALLRQVDADTPGGQLTVTGQFAWVPSVSWDVNADLQHFDPGYFLPGWNGDISGKLASSGKQMSAPAGGVSPGVEATVEIPSLTGSLRQRPLKANGRFALQGSQGEGKVKLALGNSRLEAAGKIGDQLDLNASLQPLQLDDLLPGAAGNLRGSVQLKGKQDAPDITADLTGSGLSWDGMSADALRVHGHLPWRGARGALSLEASAITAGAQLDRVMVKAEGAVEDLSLDAQVDNAMVNLAFDGSVKRNGTRWDGALSALRLVPSKGDSWTLKSPARFSVADSGKFTLSDSCLAADSGSDLCVHADWPKQGFVAHSDKLPLALVQPWLPQSAGRDIKLRGDLSLDASFKPKGNAWEGGVHIASMEGGVRVGDRPGAEIAGTTKLRGELLRYDHFSIDADFSPKHINGRLGIGFQGDGFIDAKFDTGWDDYAPLTGELYFNMSRLYWMELAVPDLSRPKGLIEGHVSLRGTRSQPSMGGEATLSDFTGEYPAMGLTVEEGKGRFTAQPDGSAKIAASAKLGDGTLNVDGGLSWYGDATPLQLKISGDNVLVYNTSDLHIVANPNLQFGIAKNTMRLRGEVEVPEAEIDLERLDRGTSASEDVVVLDPANPEEAPDSPLDLDIAIKLGDKVHINGFGLKGGLTGQMRVRAVPGYEMTANGGLDVSGRYKAYGQDLTITRGQLTWNNNVVADPRINIRAQRKVGDVTAGIDVSGRAESPRADVWSDPSMSESEAMSYLVLGRGLATASDSEANQVTAASAALSAGGGLIASQIGAKLGLDEAGISQSSTLGGSVVGFGKYLSPKIYVGYGVSMVGSGSVLTLKYLLSRGFDLEVESSTVETKGSVNWRTEK